MRFLKVKKLRRKINSYICFIINKHYTLRDLLRDYIKISNYDYEFKEYKSNHRS